MDALAVSANLAVDRREVQIDCNHRASDTGFLEFSVSDDYLQNDHLHNAAAGPVKGFGQEIPDRPSVSDLIRWLDEPLADAFGPRYGKLHISKLSQASSVADGTTVLRLQDEAARFRAVALCSPPVSPDFVQIAMQRARRAKENLDEGGGKHVLEPLAEGRVSGLSYAVLPYCDELSKSGPKWWIQRALLRPTLFGWLLRMTQCTVRDVDRSAVESDFAEPLRRMAALSPMSTGLRTAARLSVERLDAGKWTPRFVLMHGDLWCGNILLRRTEDCPADRQGWRDRFVVIDWAGSEMDGYAIFDLVRLARSMGLSSRNLRSEVHRHCGLLQCSPEDAPGYLLAALGHIAGDLQYFPFHRFAEMSEACLATLNTALE